MERLIIIALLLGSLKGINAQHLSYLGIPIDGSVEDFALLLKNKGFTLLDEKDNKYTFYGEVLKDTVITIVDYSYKSKTVYRVSQVKYLKTALLRDAYFSTMKKLYLKKYGNDASEYENLLIISEGEKGIGHIGFMKFDHESDYSLVIEFRDDKNFELNDIEKISDL